MMLLSIDPGLRAPGLALFNEANELVACTSFAIEGDRGAVSWLKAADKTIFWLRAEAGCDARVQAICYEMMECYVEQETDHANNDLLECVGSLAAVIDRVRATQGGPRPELAGYLPREWKGNKKKPIVHRRAKKRLSEDELDRLNGCLASVNESIQHNAWDAVSIGLVHLYRMRR